jgi:hypothetical protein
MVRQNRVRGSYPYVTGDYDEAEDCACDDAASDAYWGQVLAAAELNGNSMRELGLEIEGTDFETAAARFIAENGEDDFLRLERELPKEWRKFTAEASYHMATSLHSRDRASVENRPVIMILDANLMWSRRHKLGADDIHPLDEVLLGVVDVPLGIFALWKVQPMSEFYADRAAHIYPFTSSPEEIRNVQIEAARVRQSLGPSTSVSATPPPDSRPELDVG